MKKTSNEFNYRYVTDEPPILMETLPTVADVVADAEIEQVALRNASLLRQLGVASLENFTHAVKPERGNNQSLKEGIENLMVGQKQAIDSLIDAFDRSIFRESDKPHLSVLFLGPTGVGKTELVRALHTMLHGVDDKTHFTRIDCTEYQENHQASMLIGSPPGYVGREQVPVLDQVNITNVPGELHILLFDEIEKASPALQKMALQILEEGQLGMQNSSKKTDFSNCIVVFTSNLGAQEVAKAIEHVPSGFGGHANTKVSPTYETIQKIVDKEVKNALLPEFIGRIDQRVLFGALDDQQLGEVVQKFNTKLSPTVLAQGISLTLTEDLVAALVQSDDERQQYGGRRITKTFKKTILGRLGQYVSAGSIPRGSDVYAVLTANEETDGKKHGELDFEFLFAPNEALAAAYDKANPIQAMVKQITASKHKRKARGEVAAVPAESEDTSSVDTSETPAEPPLNDESTPEDDPTISDYNNPIDIEIRDLNLDILKLYRINRYGVLIPKQRFDREKDLLKTGLGILGSSIFKASIAANKLLSKPRT